MDPVRQLSRHHPIPIAPNESVVIASWAMPGPTWKNPSSGWAEEMEHPRSSVCFALEVVDGGLPSQQEKQLLSGDG